MDGKVRGLRRRRRRAYSHRELPFPSLCGNNWSLLLSSLSLLLLPLAPHRMCFRLHLLLPLFIFSTT